MPVSGPLSTIDTAPVQPAPAGPAPQTPTAQRTATPASGTHNSAKPEDLAAAKSIAIDGFTSLQLAAISQLQALKTEIGEEDPPDPVDSILWGAFQIALGAATAGVGTVLSSGIMTHFEQKTDGALAEAVKVVIESSLNAGVTAAKEVGSPASKSMVLAKFIAGQELGVIEQYQTAKRDFVTKYADTTLTSLNEINAMTTAMSHPNLGPAAVEHSKAARDAWVALVAKSAVGAVDLKNGGQVTDMTTTGERVQKSMREGTRPELGGASYGQPGILSMKVALPRILPFSVDGSHRVLHAELDGVNSTVRSAYVGKTLAELKLPRILEALPEDDESFTVSLDEQGTESSFPSEADRGWLVKRATVGQVPAAKPENELVLALRGLNMLLDQIVFEEGFFK